MKSSRTTQRRKSLNMGLKNAQRSGGGGGVGVAEENRWVFLIVFTEGIFLLR